MFNQKRYIIKSNIYYNYLIYLLFNTLKKNGNTKLNKLFNFFF